MLPAISKKVMLVIMGLGTVRRDEIESVAESPVRLDGNAAGDGVTALRGELPQEAEAPAVRLGGARGIRHKARGEHFGKDQEVRFALLRGERGGRSAVLRRGAPAGIGLKKGDFHLVLSLSAGTKIKKSIFASRKLDR